MADIDVVQAPSEDEKAEYKSEELHGLESESESHINAGENNPEQHSEEQQNNSAASPSPRPAASGDASAPVADGSLKDSKGRLASVKGKASQITKRAIADAVLVILVVVLALWCWSLSSSNNNLKTQNSSLNNQVAQLNANPQGIIQRQTEDLINKVGKLMTLPTDETPTIANVTDAAAAKMQSAFFNNAQNGDKVLMYVKAGEAILYRPSTNKIILVAPLTLNNNTTGARK